MCRFTPDTTLTFVNEAYCRFLGKRREVLLGSNLATFLPAETRELLAKSVAHALSGAGPGEWECEITYPDGSRGWHHWICQATNGGREALADRPGDGDVFYGEQIAKMKVEPHAEHKQDNADLGQLRRRLRVRKRDTGDRLRLGERRRPLER